MSHFAHIFEKHKHSVYNLCLLYVLDEEDAKDVTQDVFVQVLEKFSDFRHDAEITTWIYRIAVNKSLDFLKRKKRKLIFLSFFQLFISENSDAHNKQMHPGIQLENKEEMENLLAVIHRLPANQKSVILLSKWEQKSQREISAILNISEKSVEGLMQRAKTNIKNQLNHAKK